MGFFSSLGFKTPKVNTAASGIYSLPQNAQNAFNTITNNANTLAADTSLFKPAAFSDDQQTAFGMARDVANPTSQSIQNLVSPYMNPYMSSVIGEVNRQSQGDNSVLQQNMNAVGQLGSNRQMLGANDIDLSRMNQIGSLLSGQYNTSLNTGLGQQQQGINNLLQTGGMQQDQALQTQQAPLQANEWLSNIMKSYPTQSFMGGVPASSSGGKMDWGKVAQTAVSLFSDERLKQDIKLIGQENGHNVYEFAYKTDPAKKYIGVMAQEIQQSNPDAVEEINGYLAVNYDKIGVNFREA